MLRRSITRLSSRQHTDKERERIFRMRQQKILYDKYGNFKISGVLSVIHEQYGTYIYCVLGFGVFVYAYEHLIVYLQRQDTQHIKDLDKKSEEEMRATGKLKSDRYLSKPRRQIDDPDMHNLPAFSSTKGDFKCKLFHDDSLSSGKYNEEFRVNKG